MNKIMLGLSLLLLMLNANSQPVDYKGLPEWEWHKEGNTEYYLYTPKGMVKGEKYPIALFLHGCCGVNDHATLRNCVDPPVRMWHNFAADTQRIPTYIIAPATSRGWKQHIADLKKVMDSLVSDQNGDPKRIYICGFSMGAEGTFTFVNEYPDYFAAAMTMGMRFHGDSVREKDMPMWVNQGETDYFSRGLRKQVKSIRILNGYAADTGATYITGVNPLYSIFKGFGHPIQWEATTRQDMVDWAYAHVNDGNKYPTIFFDGPDYGSTVAAGKPLNVSMQAYDVDGTVKSVQVYLNHRLVATLDQAPYHVRVTPANGKNVLEAVATDALGKSHSALLVVNTKTALTIATPSLPSVHAGDYYRYKLSAEGYGDIQFNVPDQLPPGLELSSSGTLHGVPSSPGVYKITFTVVDNSGSKVNKTLVLSVKEKKPSTVLVTDAVTTEGKMYKISKMMAGEAPNFNSKDSSRDDYTEEINFSGLDKYKGLTYIKTDVNDTAKTAEKFLSFRVDEDVTVYVAYEAMDAQYHSTIPDWLTSFTRQDGQIVAQYRYFNIYTKKFPKGDITLPASDTGHNGVACNYFVMVEKQ
jgi:hypothetical protein